MAPAKKSSRRRQAGPVQPSPVRAGSLFIGDGRPLALIAGPCVLESEQSALSLARHLAAMAARLRAPMIFKASYDKANRTSVTSFRGPGPEKGLAILSRIKGETGLPVMTDVHSPAEVEAAAEVVDILQIPAFLCRQTDLLVAAAATGKAVNVKKGQFLAPGDVRHILGKTAAAGGRNVLVTERGSTFGYHRLVVDFCSLPIMRSLGAPVIFDATHSVQSPGGEGGTSGGNREMVPYLARAAAAVGCDAFFFEVHRRPERAKSDGPNSIKPEVLEALWPDLVRIDRIARRGK